MLKGDTNVKAGQRKENKLKKDRIREWKLKKRKEVIKYPDRTNLFGLCKAFKCQPLEERLSLTSKMSMTSEPNATTVMSGFPMINNSGISSILVENKVISTS